MPILPVLPQQRKRRRSPSLAFRGIFLFTLLLFISISGLMEFQMQQSDDIPHIEFRSPLSSKRTHSLQLFRSPIVQRAYGEKEASVAAAMTVQVKQLAIGAMKVLPTATVIPLPTQSAEQWGVAKQIDADTWTMKVAQDSQQANPQEILSALNDYRKQHGKGALAWDQKLADFASQRTSYFISINKLDNHAGFLDYVHNQDGFHKLGYAAIGENSSIGYILSGVHLIEWIYGGDKPHDDNQLSSQWQFVGIGVDASATDLVFAGSKL